MSEDAVASGQVPATAEQPRTTGAPHGPWPQPERRPSQRWSSGRRGVVGWIGWAQDHIAPPGTILAVMIGVYVYVFGRLTWMQQSNFGTFGFDMGIFDQGIWLLSRFKEPFITLRGLTIWGNHVNPNVLLLVPVYWLGGGPHALYFIETVALALGAVPVWLMARDRMQEPWSALVVAGAYLLYPTLEWVNWWHFHPEALAVTPMLYAWWFARNGRWWHYAACVALVAACKEDAAFVVLAIGVMVALYFNVKAGLLTVGGGLVWLLIAFKVIIPGAVKGSNPFYLDRFSTFGRTLPGIVYNLFRHPSRAARLAVMRNRLNYYRMLFVPVAGLAFLDAAVLVSLPVLVVNVVSTFGYTYNTHNQYSSLIIPGVFIGVTEACGKLRAHPPTRRAAMGLLAVAVVASNVAWSPSPIGVMYNSGIWAMHKADEKTFNHAVALVPRGAGVSASYSIDSHLSHRVHDYEWPNPFKTGNWGVNDQHPDPVSNVDYLVLDTSLNQDSASLLRALLGPGGGFEVIYRSGVVLVARRFEPTTAAAANPASAMAVTTHPTASQPSGA